MLLADFARTRGARDKKKRKKKGELVAGAAATGSGALVGGGIGYLSKKPKKNSVRSNSTL